MYIIRCVYTWLRIALQEPFPLICILNYLLMWRQRTMARYIFLRFGQFISNHHFIPAFLLSLHRADTQHQDLTTEYVQQFTYFNQTAKRMCNSRMNNKKTTEPLFFFFFTFVCTEICNVPSLLVYYFLCATFFFAFSSVLFFHFGLIVFFHSTEIVYCKHRE